MDGAPVQNNHGECTITFRFPAVVSNAEEKVRKNRQSDTGRLLAVAPVGTPVVQGVRLVELLYNRAGFKFTATSLPGHLIHLVVSGHVRQEMNGRWHDLRAGDAVWYHENEL